MASEVQTFSCTIPPGTPSTAPVVINLTMPTRIVQRIEWVVPPGPNGFMGFALGAAGQAVLPYGSQQWVITSDEKDGWDLSEQIDSGAWQFFGYNNGGYPHTVYLRFLVDQVGQAAPATTTTPIDPTVLAPLTADDLAALSTPVLDTMGDLGSTDDPELDADLAGAQ